MKKIIIKLDKVNFGYASDKLSLENMQGSFFIKAQHMLILQNL